MKSSKLLWGLVLLNVLLVIVLMMQLGGENVARAQEAQQPRGDYLLIPADVPGVTNGVIYMLDTRNGVLGGWIYEQGPRKLSPIPPIDVARLYSR